MITIRCTKPEKATVSYTLLVGKKYTVGRKGADLSFPDDQSISRNHAEIVVEHPMANMTDPLLTPIVVVTDLGSKFGTFANDGIERKSKMAMREALNLSPGDRFKFGLQWNEFKIEYTPLIATPSAVKEHLLKNLKLAIMNLGGHLVSEWVPECNYVVMEPLSLTVKAVCGLLSAKYFVTPVFFDDFLECIKTRKALPNPNDYLPVCDEKNIPSDATFEPIRARSELFAGKVFVFCSTKHMKKLGAAVEAGGGTCKVLSEVRNRDLLSENYILMKPTDKDMMVTDHNGRAAIDAYTAKKRPIQDSELGLAAVNMSIKEICNPYHSFSENLPKMPSQSQQPEANSIPYEATQDMETQLSYGHNSTNIVNETLVTDKKDTKVKTEPTSQPTKGKAKPVKMDDGEPPSKKRPAEESLSSVQNREKRLRPATRSQKKTGLNAIFGFSDSEDEEEPHQAHSSRHLEVLVPETQYPESSTMDPHYGTDFIPATPEKAPTPEVVVLQTPERRSTRSRVIKSLSPQSSPSPVKSVLSAFKEPQPASKKSGGAAAGGTKRKLLQTPETSPTKIASNLQETKKLKTRKETQDSMDAETVVKIEQMNLTPDIKDILSGDDVPPLFPEVLALLCQRPKIQPRLQCVDGRTVRNFKTFRKVLPLSMQSTNVSFASELCSTSTSSIIPSPKKSKLMYEVYEYAPTTPLYAHRQNERHNNTNYDPDETEVAIQPMIKRRITREEVNIEDIMPETDVPPPPLPENTTTSRRPTRTKKQQGSQQPREEEEEVRDPSPQRQTRRTRNAPKVQLQSDDEDDDMFQF